MTPEYLDSGLGLYSQRVKSIPQNPSETSKYVQRKKHLKDKDQNVNSENFPVSGLNDFYFYFHNLKRKLF